MDPPPSHLTQLKMLASKHFLFKSALASSEHVPLSLFYFVKILK